MEAAARKETADGGLGPRTQRWGAPRLSGGNPVGSKGHPAPLREPREEEDGPEEELREEQRLPE